jgi:AraC-like DNA-binding protein
MQQETTIINAEELCKNFSKMSEFLNSQESFERYWKWPDGIGNGFMYVMKFRPGLMLGIGDYQLWENLTVSFEVKSSPFIITFSVPGNVWSTLGNGQGKKDLIMFNSGQSFISYLPEWQGIAEYPARTPVRTVGIYIDPLLLNAFLDGQHDRFPTGMHDIVNGTNEKHYHHSLTTTPAVNLAVHQILNCPYQGSLRRLYLESKTLELIAHNLAQLVVDKNGHNKTFILQSGDIERVREARDVLIRNLENPPSLLELAMMVGINKNKLSQSFRQVFGTSVFEHLRIHRLELARELLESKEKNVTEVAFEVGYAQHGNFTRAFKKHFGINPTDHLR